MQETTFYEQLQNCKELDLRDNRGKRHNLAFVLLGLSLGLLRKRDGSLSSIHRSMVNKNSELCMFLEIDYQEVISRSHLPIILKKVSLCAFENLIFENYGIELSAEEKSWFAGDGKELRGSILKGDKRGDAIVQLVQHSDREVLGQNYYNGKKESEKPCLRELIIKTGASNQKITADALHLNPATTNLISKSGGFFLIGLKANQKELFEDMVKCSTYLTPVNQEVTTEKGHGRLEKRTYFHYEIGDEYFAQRWEKTNFQSLFKVTRQRLEMQTGKESIETDYYISNAKSDESAEFFSAIRKHWSVEVNNHIRDVTLQEDKLKTKKSLLVKYSQVLERW
jgi:predicted transposase YbfD/YdcC